MKLSTYRFAFFAGVLFAASASYAAGAEPEQTAKCIFRGLAPSALFEKGMEAEGTPPSRWAAGTCPGAAEHLYSSGYREATAKQLQALLQDNLGYRAGRYAKLAEPKAPLEVKTRLGEMGVFFEDVYKNRRAVVACKLVDPVAVEFVGQLDGSFALVATGRFVGFNDIEAAKKVSSALLVKAQAAAGASKSLACGPVLTKTFQANAQQWQQFVQGEHPWAPGCKVVPEDSDFLLKCSPRSAKK